MNSTVRVLPLMASLTLLVACGAGGGTGDTTSAATGGASQSAAGSGSTAATIGSTTGAPSASGSTGGGSSGGATGGVSATTSASGSTTGAEGAACAAIANFRAIATSTSAVALAWSGAAGVTASLSRKSYCGTDAYLTVTTLPAGSASYTDTSVNPDWVYWYELVATDGQGHASRSVAIGVQAGAMDQVGCAAGASAQPSGVPTSACQAGGVTTGSSTSSTTSSSGSTSGASTSSGSSGTTGSGGAPGCPAGALDVQSQGATGNGTTDDTTAIQGALNTAGANRAVLFPAGTYRLSSTLTLPAGANLCGSGQPILTNPSAQGYLLQSSASGITISGLTFNGGGILLTSSTSQAGWSITDDTFQNITSGNDAIHVNNILGKGAASTISHDTFKNIWSGGYPNFPSGTGPDSLPGTGIYWHQGIDNTTLDSNSFDEISFDAIKGFNDGFSGKINPYTASNVVISNNVMTRVHRMGIETMGGGSNCPGGCDYSVINNTGMVVKNNYFHDPAFQQDTFAFSVALDVNGLFINNAAIIEIAACVWPLGIGVEHELSGGTFQGNVIAAVKQGCSGGFNPTYGWASYICPGYTRSGYTTAYRNNISCGDQAAKETALTNDDPYVLATVDEKYDDWADACPAGANLASSQIALSFTSSDNQAFPSGGSGTWRAAAVSTLPLKHVSFYLDGATSPVAVQELQDVNPSFVTTLQWLYHLTTDTTALASGPHTLTAVATDLAGVTQSATQSFTR